MLYINGVEVGTGVFPNGETYVKVDAEDWCINSRFVKINLVFENNNDLINLMFLKRYLDDKGLEARLIILYFPYSRMDRENANYAFSLKYVTEFIDSLNFYKVTIMEPHSDVTPALLRRVSTYSWIDDKFEYICDKIGFSEYTDLVCYPDAGAVKRYSNTLKMPYCYGSKLRDFKTGNIIKHKLINDSDNKNPEKIIIIDDLCSRGGTFMSMAKALREEFKNNPKIYLAVAHCEKNIENGDLLKEDSPIDIIFTSDSLIRNTNNKIEVIRG